MSHPHRRQYEGIVFLPGREIPNHYNLWRGFAVEPRQGDCSKFLAHLKDNVCQGDEESYRWVVGWFANIIQHPNEKTGTALVLRGKMGTGKTIVGYVFGAVIGRHYVSVSNPRYVTGRFNSQLVSCLLLHADEAFWAGDREAEGQLKDLITGEVHFIEFKGKEPIPVDNYVRLLVTGNPDWLVPAGFEERRFATFDIGDKHMQDIPYFKAIINEMKNGGSEALLYHLSNFDLSSINLSEIPKTAALLDQKLSSLTPEQGWLLDTLMRGELPYDVEKEEDRKCPTSALFDRYINHASKHGVRRRSIEVVLGTFLKKYVPGLRKIDTTYGKGNSTRQGYVYVFPPLAECRAAFSKMLHQDFDWPEKGGWTIDLYDPGRM